MIQENTQYVTKPLESWGRMKELRRAHFKHIWEAQRRGELVIMGIFEWFLALCAGFGDYSNPSYGPYFTGMMRDKQQAARCFEMAQSKGFGQGICASMRCHLGQLFMGLTERGPTGEVVKPDFILQPAACYAMNKTGRIVSEQLDIPYLCVDFPTKDTKDTRHYLITQLEDTINAIEKLTGRTFDDEKFIDAVRNEWQSMVLWSRICEFNKSIPAPLSYRQMWSLRIPNITMRHRTECVDFYKLLFDEVQERVRQGISAHGYETRRLLHMFMPPFYALWVLREPEKYGALFVGGEGVFAAMGAWSIQQDGSWEAAKTPDERGITLRTRQDALASMVDLYLDHLPPARCVIFADPNEIISMVRDWHADGVVFMLDRGCRTLSIGQEDQILALKQSGIPTMAYEGSHADFRDFNDATVIRQFEVFCQNILGLNKITRLHSKGGRENESFAGGNTGC